VSAAEFSMSSRRFTLAERDRAAVMATLNTGPVTREVAGDAIGLKVEHNHGASGSIAGTVADKSGAVIPGVKVTLKNEGNHSTFDGTTNGSGVFSFPVVLPGSYSVTVSAPGLRTYVLQRIVVTRGAAVGPEFTGRAMQMLLDARTEKGEQARWTAEETGMYGAGESAAVETTGLAVQALLKWGQASNTAAKALAYLASKKSAAGTWGTTQATIMALRALLLATEKGTSDVRGTVEITLNGKPVEKLTLTPDNNDLLHQFVFKDVEAKTANEVAIRFDGKGGLAYQVVGRYFLPWTEKPAAEALSIDVSYDRTRLAQDDISTAAATVKNNLPKSANMVMVDLGIPPGFDLLTEDLQTYQEQSTSRKSGRLEKFNLTATQAILYFDSIGAGDTVKLSFRLRAKYPIRARTFPSRAYEYYDPEVNSVARPVQLEVAKR